MKIFKLTNISNLPTNVSELRNLVRRNYSIYKQSRPIPLKNNSPVKKNNSPQKSPSPVKNNSPQKSVLFVIVGLGCSVRSENVRIEYAKKYSEYYGIPTHYMCNTTERKSVKNIAKAACGIRPSLKSTFVVRVLTMMKQYMDFGYKVYASGHSYGGSVVSRIALALSADPSFDPNMFSAITFGSIYVPETKGVDIKHYMFNNDVALRCNGLKPGKGKDVIWMKHADESKARKKWWTVAGNQYEWKIHNDYKTSKYISEMIKRG
jgi:hypothetical protein